MKITNTQDGPRGINTVNGPVLVDPKQTVEAKVYEREKAHIEAAGWFTVEGRYEADPSEGGSTTSVQAADATGALRAKDIEIENLKGGIIERDAEIEKLKKQLPETDVDKMTVAELRAHLAFKDIAFDSKKDKKDDLVTLAKAAAA